MFDYLCFNLYLETFGLHPFLSQFVVFNKNLVLLNHSYIKENLILFICTFCFNIRFKNCLKVQERSSILLTVLETTRNCSNATKEHFTKEIGAVKWRPENI